MPTVDANGLAGLTFYALDRASPFELALSPNTNSLDLVLKYELATLQIVAPTGIRDLWLIINAHVSRYGGKPVSPEAAMKCKTAKDVWNAVRLAAGLNVGDK